jgi:hypothetical protein
LLRQTLRVPPGFVLATGKFRAKSLREFLPLEGGGGGKRVKERMGYGCSMLMGFCQSKIDGSSTIQGYPQMPRVCSRLGHGDQ